MSDIFTIIILFVVGSGLCIVASKLIEKKKRVIANAVETDGIVFELEHSTALGDKSIYPIIRFVTRDGTWVSEKGDYALLPFMLKRGQQVKVIYNSENPNEFIYKTSFDFSKLSYLFIGVGIVAIVSSLWLLYKYLTG